MVTDFEMVAHEWLSSVYGKKERTETIQSPAVMLTSISL